MRSLRLLALLAPALLLPVACEDSSGSSSGAVFSPDAGPGFEAGPPAEAGPLPDGALPDTSTVPLGVTVTVFEASAPKKDVRVIFHDAAGLVTGQALTDIAGKVFVATAPSMVTVLTKDASQRPSAVTYAGVADGDNLKVVSSVNPSVAGTYDISVTANDPLLANATGLEIRAANGCAGGGGIVGGVANVPVPLYTDCLGAQNLVFATAFNGGGLLGLAFAKNVAAPVAAGTVGVTLPLFTAPGTTTVKATNLPSGVGIGTSAGLLAIVGGQAAVMNSATGTLGGTGVVFPTAAGFADAYQSSAKATLTTTSASDKVLVRREATAAPANAVLTPFDFNTSLPFITAVVAAQPVPARPDVTFTIADPAAMATSDAAIAKLTWFATSLDTSGSWTFVLPPSTTSFKFPALPADATEFAPVTDSFTVDYATFFDSSQLPSFKAAKLLPIVPAFGLDFIESTRVLPAAGTLRVSRFTPNAG